MVQRLSSQRCHDGANNAEEEPGRDVADDSGKEWLSEFLRYGP
jgi:hypothetical protein